MNERLLASLNHVPKKAKGRSRIVYLVKCREFHKIGKASNMASRLNALQCGCPFEMQLVSAWMVKDALRTEQMLHRLFEAKHVRGEWFNITDDDVVMAHHFIKHLDANATQTE